MFPALTSIVEVPCSREKAFKIFTEQMGTWWPIHQRSMSMAWHSKPAKSLEVQAKLGGKITEIGDDDTQHHWGTFTDFAPHDRVRFDLHMGMPPDQTSHVEVVFEALSDNATRVILTQTNFEGFGEMAAMVLQGYTSGWPVIFEQAYAKACA
jgi:hypothetical protein